MKEIKIFTKETHWYVEKFTLEDEDENLTPDQIKDLYLNNQLEAQWSEFVDDSFSSMEPEENKGYSTLIIKDLNGKIIYENGKSVDNDTQTTNSINSSS